MTNEEILAAFVLPKAFPAEAIALAGARRDEIAPLLVAEVEAAAAGRRADIKGFYYLTDIACHLLGEWRDQRGFKPLLALLASPHEEMLGASVTESVPLLLARMYDGDEAALRSLIRDEDAEEFVRDAAFGAYTMLALEGRIARQDAHAFVLDFFETAPRQPVFVWSGWIDAVAQLRFEDLVPQVKELFGQGVIDETWMDYEDFEAMLGNARESAVPGWMPSRSPIEVMELWRYDAADDSPEDQSDDEDIDSQLLAGLDGMPAVNPYKDVGRNDPCPCGSGKKFKKCCLPKIEAGLM